MGKYARQKQATSATRLILDILADNDGEGQTQIIKTKMVHDGQSEADAIRTTVSNYTARLDVQERLRAWVFDQVDWDALSAHDPWASVARSEYNERYER